MPYADPERRQQYQREYKRRWSKAQEKINPLRGFKIYICPRFPNIRIGRACFDNGFLITNDLEVQAQVEAHREFGMLIFPVAMDLTCTLMEKEDE